MRSSELRKKFLEYFERNGHTKVRSSSLVPAEDPTLYFTNAGMVQFKEVFLGLEKRPYTRATSSQKCMRVSGKHNDLENVGYTPRHHTFFEMLGNFSFGDYFKKEAINYAWEFLTKEIGLSKERLYITVFRDDDEAEGLWAKLISKDRIFRLDEKDNFWAMGDSGPCGPCSEILWDFGKGKVTKKDLDTDRFMEIWNLVFMQFDKDEKGKMTPLAKPCIDTGMGLERLAAVVNGNGSNWETDLFEDLISKIRSEVKLQKTVSSDEEIALRVIADHIRGISFLIADGVTPSNEGRGYVLRRIMRRAIRYGRKLGRETPFLSKIIPTLVDNIGGAYPELVKHRHFIEKVVLNEEERFLSTLDKGLDILNENFRDLKKKKKSILPGEVVFKLYDTYGFPKDLTEVISKENKVEIDSNEFENLMRQQRERARSSWKGSGEVKIAEIYHDLVKSGVESKFVGYKTESSDAKLLAIVKDNKRVKDLKGGDSADLIFDMTPFYGESGGQVGDIGLAVSDEKEFEVKDTKKPLPNLIIHRGVVKKGRIAEGDKLILTIDSDRRQDIRCNHTATHLLHRALRETLGEHVKQAGSLVESSRLRFDFSHFEAVTKSQLKEIEMRVNEIVRENIPVVTEELSYDEAVKKGALAFFGEKYADKVRVVEVKDFSSELCGGTHLNYTGSIGFFKILSESSVAAGIRRIEAITGREAEKYLSNLDDERNKLADLLKSSTADISDRVQRLVERNSKLEKDLKNALTGGVSLSRPAKDLKEIKINGATLRIEKTNIAERGTFNALAEARLKELGSGIVVLGSVIDNNVTVCVVVSEDLVKSKKAHAGNIIKLISEVFGGRGGGRPDFAQGGGKDVEKFGEFINIVTKIVEGFCK